MDPKQIALARTPGALKLNTFYKRSYEAACGWARQENPPAWEELTDAQRKAVRQEVQRHLKEMNDFGAALSRSATPPQG